ncbi:MAG: methionine synthase [Clostridiales bacterium]|nr:methionine synthase [Clostridiales bacterium]
MKTNTKNEVLRYLGYRGQEISPGLSAQIDGAIAECRAVTRARHVLRRFSLREDAKGIYLTGTELTLSGRAITRNLAKAKEVALLAATLGTEIESRIRRAQYSDLAYALMLDAAASQLIEEVCDAAETSLRTQAAAEGLCIGSRFSPGYDDLPLGLQTPLLSLLDAPRRIGLNCTDKYLLTPGKSVTALIGIYQGQAPGPERGCDHCPMQKSCFAVKGVGGI